MHIVPSARHTTLSTFVPQDIRDSLPLESPLSSRMAMAKPQDSFTFTIGKLGMQPFSPSIQVVTHRSADAGMAVRYYVS